MFVAALGHLWGPNKERGLFKSIDGGKTWRHVLFVDNDTGVVDVAIDPPIPKIMYAAAYQRRRRAWGFHGGGPGSGLYKSIDGGDTWTKLTGGLPEGDKGRIGIAIYRKDPRIVYVCVEQGVRYNAATAYGERKAGVYRSEDKGDTWSHMSDWNPRPMYASQIRVDPNDDKRIYMVNAFSYSDDGGKTFKVPRQSLHGDDRVVWIDPRDSRHLIKGDDGGIGISYDRGEKWLYVPNLPVSQFYRVSVDMRKPFWVYGGLQDNGSWAGPSATFESWGVLNEHWMRTGGGDGFYNVIDPSDNRTLVHELGEYLGLSRFDLVTRERVDIRPGSPRGFIAARRNWDTWGKPGAAGTGAWERDAAGQLGCPGAALAARSPDRLCRHERAVAIERPGPELGVARRPHDGHRPFDAARDDPAPVGNDPVAGRRRAVLPDHFRRSPSRRSGAACSMSAPTTATCRSRAMPARPG